METAHPPAHTPSSEVVSSSLVRGAQQKYKKKTSPISEVTSTRYGDKNTIELFPSSAADLAFHDSITRILM
jgi:hypothetical protein